jgi:hypothetical protein
VAPLAGTKGDVEIELGWTAPKRENEFCPKVHTEEALSNDEKIDDAH